MMDIKKMFCALITLFFSINIYADPLEIQVEYKRSSNLTLQPDMPDDLFLSNYSTPLTRIIIHNQRSTKSYVDIIKGTGNEGGELWYFYIPEESKASMYKYNDAARKIVNETLRQYRFENPTVIGVPYTVLEKPAEPKLSQLKQPEPLFGIMISTKLDIKELNKLEKFADSIRPRLLTKQLFDGLTITVMKIEQSDIQVKISSEQDINLKPYNLVSKIYKRLSKAGLKWPNY